MTGIATALALLAAAGLAAPTGPPDARDAQAACPALRWTMLGTAGGPVPTAERSEPANLLHAGGRAILVDTGDGTVGQLARAGHSVGEVDAIFLSHLHLDHTAGLAAVIGLRWMNEFPGTITVYGPRGTAEVVEGILASLGPPSRIGFGLGTSPPSPWAGVRVRELGDGDRVELGALAVSAAANSHFVRPGGAGGDPGTASLSYRFALGGRSITYTGDTGPSAAVADLASGSDLLVSEVIALEPLMAEIARRRTDASEEHREQMRQHLSTHHVAPEDVGAMAAAAGVGHVVLTHYAIPGPLRMNEAYLRDGVRRRFSGPLDLARDLSSFDVGCR